MCKTTKFTAPLIIIWLCGNRFWRVRKSSRTLSGYVITCVLSGWVIFLFLFSIKRWRVAYAYARIVIYELKTQPFCSHGLCFFFSLHVRTVRKNTSANAVSSERQNTVLQTYPTSHETYAQSSRTTLLPTFYSHTSRLDYECYERRHCVQYISGLHVRYYYYYYYYDAPH